MRTALFFLAELQDQDLDWLASAGTKTLLRSGQVLVKQGETLPALYLTLRGQFSVTTAEGKTLGMMGPGEVVGEISFLDSRPPSATVTATENSNVLAVPTGRLRARLRSDLGFASRFYRSLGVMLAHRLRDQSRPKATGAQRDLDDKVEMSGEFSPELLDKLNLSARRFEELMAKLSTS